MLKKIINYTRGSVRVKISGGFIERFLNICSSKEVGFWQVVRIDDYCILASMTIDGYKKVRNSAKKCGCSIKIADKKGIPFTINNNNKRYGIFVGFIACCIGFWLLSTRIWTIEIKSDGFISDTQVLSIAESYGLKTGAEREKIDVKQMRNDILEKESDFAYFNVNFYGSHAEIVVRKREPKPENADSLSPCDIIADKDGMIYEMIVREGQKVKNVGNTVIKGDTIVSGSVTGRLDAKINVHSTAEITLKTWRKVEIMIPRIFEGKEYTGKTANRYHIILGNKSFKLNFLEKIPFICYDKKYNKNPLKLGESFFLPISLVKETYFEYQPKNLERLPKEGSLMSEGQESFKARYPQAQILEESVDIKEVGNFFKVIYRATCLEQAGVERKIDG